MTDRDMIQERGRSMEDDYFRKKDRELIEKIQRASEAERARADVGRAAGLTDPALAQELLELGFTADTVSLLPLVPILQMAWAEGGVSGAERDLIVRFARSRGISEGSAADQQLTSWLTERPAETVFAQAGRLIRAMLDSGSDPGLKADDLVAYAEKIAAASGGVFGIGRVSAEERKLLSGLAADLKGRQSS
jgi:hypothetical protein